MKVELEFPGDFALPDALPMHLGRLYIGQEGKWHVRFVLRPTGQLCLVVEEGAVADGSLILIKPAEDCGIGFGLETPNAPPTR